jgi:RNA polymerase sigma-70 factor (ECF subfamily)
VADAGFPGDDPNVRGSGNDAADAWIDPEMLAGVRRRDSKSLAVFFEVAFPYVYNLAFRLTGNREAAEDISQDVFVKIYQAADRLRLDRHPKPWITAITYNACRDAARRSAVRSETPEDPAEIGERSGESATPEDIMVRKERDALTQEALLGLDAESRTVVILHDFCHMAHEDIARIMEAGHAAVRKRYSRALKRMAEIIKGLQ